MDVTVQEIEMLANLLARAGVNQYEALWANSLLDRLRAIAAKDALEQQAAPGQKEGVDDEAD